MKRFIINDGRGAYLYRFIDFVSPMVIDWNVRKNMALAFSNREHAEVVARLVLGTVEEYVFAHPQSPKE